MRADGRGAHRIDSFPTQTRADRRRWPLADITIERPCGAPDLHGVCVSLAWCAAFAFAAVWIEERHLWLAGPSVAA